MNQHIKTYNALVKSFGQDWHEITEPETFSVLFPDMTQQQADLLDAFKVISSTIIPWSDCFVFENVVDAINGNPVDTDTATQPDLDDILYGMYIMESIRPGIPYSTDVAKYIAARGMVEGLLYIPPPANIANEFLRIPADLLPIAKKISALSPDGILAFTPALHPDDSIYSVQLDKLQDILLAYRAKIDQSVVSD